MRLCQGAHQHSLGFQPLVDFARDGHAAWRIRVNADGVGLNRQLGPVSGNHPALNGDADSLFRGTFGIIEQRTRKSTLAKRSVRLVDAIGESFCGTR